MPGLFAPLFLPSRRRISSIMGQAAVGVLPVMDAGMDVTWRRATSSGAGKSRPGWPAGHAEPGRVGRPALDLDAPHHGETDDPQARGAGRARAARSMVEGAHEADAGDVYVHVLGHGDADAPQQGERPDRDLGRGEPGVPEVELDATQDG